MPEAQREVEELHSAVWPPRGPASARGALSVAEALDSSEPRGGLSNPPHCRTPIAVRSIDVEGNLGGLQLPASRSGEPYRSVAILLRRAGSPLGWFVLPVSPAGGVSLAGLAAMRDLAVEPGSEGSELTGPTPVDTPARSPKWDLQVESPAGTLGGASHRDSPPPAESLLSVVVATCANTDLVARCVEAVCRGAGEPCEVIVVENRPESSIVERMLEQRFGSDGRVRYVEERRPGLSCARNAGLRAARGDLVAFTDDDVLVDPTWVPTIRAAFAATPEVDCVTGLILPLELETPAQLIVERFASYGKGLVPRTYSLDRPPPDQPLFPYTAGYFGSGANMAFRTRAIRDIGGFDAVLGTGTRARGGEDLDICIRLLHAGGRLAYEPRAIVWHRHPDTMARLRRQVFDYGAGLGAMLSKQILTGPDRRRIVSRVPQGIHYFTDPKSRKNAARGSTFPRKLTCLERAGVLYGPAAYLESLLEARR